MTGREAEGVLRLLAVNYSRDLSKNPALVDLWCEVLRPYPAPAVRAAVLAHIARSPYWPTLSEVLTPLAQADQLDADEAWAQVLAEVRRVGLYGTPQFADPLVADTVARLGWRAVCTSEAPDVLRGQFRQFYQTARDRVTTQAAVRRLQQGLHARGVAAPLLGDGGASC